LGLAEWLLSKENPLTARVFVNRVWAQLFGQGLVQTLEDFGTQGSPPSHPELLDYLALSFREKHQWRLKSLLREIVLSATYQQSSVVSPELLERDPTNRLLARGPRVRLTAEQIRDQALAVSGLLSKKRFGPSVMPPQPKGTWQVIRNVMRWQPSKGEDRYRRAIYTFWRRSSPFPFLTGFDSPSREFCVSRRIATNTPLQSLISLNDSTMMEASSALADRMASAGDSVSGQISFGMEQVLGRPTDQQSLAELKQFYHESLNWYQAHPADVKAILFHHTKPDPERAALVQVANVLLNLDEFFTKG
ncbi:MAG: DUF1553 domain-containing protein, partial [Bacteroidota bacterium]